MDMQTIRKEAKRKLQGYCRVCPICDGRACAGEVPGMGGIGTGSSFQANVEALKKHRLKMRALHDAKDPDITCQLFGQQLTTPVLAAPMAGTALNMGGGLAEEEFIAMLVSGARQAGSIGFTGDGPNPSLFRGGIEAIKQENGWGIPIIKPREQAEIINLIKVGEAAGAKAVGVDIDAAGLVNMTRQGQPVGPKTAAELREIIASTPLPFIVKGIMTVDDAETAAAAGAKAIVVSNHGGRALDHTPGTAEVLPAIAKAVGDRVTVLVDGGVRSGVDVLKMLALGAKGVLVGRPLILGAFGGGTAGVRFLIEQYSAELRQAMILTGCRSLAEINATILC